ncbi:TPA: hypothetical protein HA338_05495 [Methanosarcina acetivorans]|uniref:Uncharacterized protein n=2 Tax=Methanosarcina acetivorans TaxID=2214 RepID=Q8TPU7_METAC|nr:hypothetical protein [Methanosarcina acetivorans]AAM05213.1 predicted protein [Methanosarcina acetivorans C2A]HIH93499.1 hypothetical protein [Methanosarcina acetivorans]
MLENVRIEFLEENARLKHRIWSAELRVENLEKIVHSKIFLNQNRISGRLIELFEKRDYEAIEEYLSEVLTLETQIEKNGKTVEDIEEIVLAEGGLNGRWLCIIIQYFMPKA